MGKSGIEPETPEPQSGMLPLHYNPHIEQEPRKPARPYPTPRTRLVSFSVDTFGTFTDIHGFLWYLILVTLQAQVVYETSLCS